VRRLCRRGTILRNGESIETLSLKGVEDDRIFEMMVGSAVRAHKPSGAGVSATANPVAVSVKKLAGGNVHDVSLDVRRGEIVGIAALEGQGQRDLFRMLAGLTKIDSGEVTIDGERAVLVSPAAAVKAGIGFVPEERKTEGVFLGLRTDTNMSLPLLRVLSRFGVMNGARERQVVADEAKRVDLAERYLKLKIGELSGGNQQKALIGRVMASGARNLVLFDPTRGVDVGTKAVIYGVIRDFVQKGGSALVYSTELSELVHLADRCVVIYRGRVAGVVPGDELSEPSLVALATGQRTGH
jgi:ribose transport system ATP-binding protein